MFPKVSGLFEPEERKSLKNVSIHPLPVSPFATHCTGISPVSTVNPEDVSLHVRVPGEKLETNSAGELVFREGRGFKLRIFMMLLEFVCLEWRS